jgi:alanyl-tRNA synthetase
MTGDEIRDAFLNFFSNKGHLIYDSAPLVPKDDPSLLWINAGMAPFKPYFDGRLIPPKNRIVSSQKCIRTNDIENVGKTARHHTFFEMLGNFSFGDYFKEDAIKWAWEFVTEVLKLDRDRLWITIYKDDNEAFDIWNNIIGIKKERIIKMGKKDNFWEIGTGPCGPCSEIHYDRGEEYGNTEKDIVGGEGDRFLEIWNLVFTQYNRMENGDYLPLPDKNIDTGMGLERVASILQGVDSNFETDLLKPIVDFVSEDTGINYNRDDKTRMAFRVIADHIRGVTMAIYDGVLPSNEGRGYVIRRILRRAVRYGGKLGYKEPFMYKIVPTVLKIMANAYPELKDKKEIIQSAIKGEEERFLQTLEQGLSILNEMMRDLKENQLKVLSGEEAFKIYDTYGFPLDLTRDVLEENFLDVDEEGFSIEMEKQRNRARQAREDIGFSGPEAQRIYSKLNHKYNKTKFSGYKKYEDRGKILTLIKDGKEIDILKKGESGELVLDNTPFYAESGGQLGDKGIIKGDNSIVKVLDTIKKTGLSFHMVEITGGEIKTGQEVTAEVFSDIRKATTRNHSATHLLQKALKEILGDHVQQSGSLVAPERLRFDFNHFSALSSDQLKRIEERVNEIILKNLAVETFETELDKAKKMGATALFGEKYGNIVRLVKIGNYSLELCGGTHVNNTGEIGLFKIISESGIAAGIRRIEAITGFEVLSYINKQKMIIDDASYLLRANPSELTLKIEQILSEKKEQDKEISSLKDRLASSKSDDLFDRLEEVNGIHFLTAELNGMDNDGLRKMADQLKSKINSAVIVLASNFNGKLIFVAVVTEDLIKKGYHAGKIISKVAKVAGGGGGGRPDMAQAGGQRVDKLSDALAELKKILINI